MNLVFEFCKCRRHLCKLYAWYWLSCRRFRDKCSRNLCFFSTIHICLHFLKKKRWRWNAWIYSVVSLCYSIWGEYSSNGTIELFVEHVQGWEINSLFQQTTTFQLAMSNLNRIFNDNDGNNGWNTWKLLS